jgi:hypothetical protein
VTPGLCEHKKVLRRCRPIRKRKGRPNIGEVNVRYYGSGAIHRIRQVPLSESRFYRRRYKHCFNQAFLVYTATTMVDECIFSSSRFQLSELVENPRMKYIAVIIRFTLQVDNVGTKVNKCLYPSPIDSQTAASAC